ncbi:hypothetical protein JI435_441120 [Parastagonospora nodorum SN15]|uniref:Uncharacterized protein n=1 Tax=Phaeosphaeria nodorum (strain SN15 / ATCC MYA-4574 / FGSC 10173) TaxID=321614 RepID=A0A7U2FGV6_PHANO|nr:hypothetical protein JI435_441120 [Parastagonospora nodorum SN15]
MSSSLAINCGAQWLSLPRFPPVLVRRVVLRLGDYITSSHRPVVDLLPMLELVWRNNAGEPKIKFDRTEKAREGTLLVPICPAEPAVYKLVLNRLLHVPGTKDSLDLKRSSTVMRQVLITSRDAEGQVVYRSSRPEGDTESIFAIPGGVKVLEMLNLQPLSESVG